MTPKTFSRATRLKSTQAFRAVYRRGHWAHAAAVSLGARKNRGRTTKVGIRTRRGMKGAVVRNRLRRQMRAVFQAHQDRLATGYDLVIVLHPMPPRATSSELEREFIQLCNRLKLLT